MQTTAPQVRATAALQAPPTAVADAIMAHTDAVAAAAPPKLNKNVTIALGQKLSKDFESYERDRRIAEMKWTKNYRQFLGVYDPEIEKQIDVNRSKAYPKLTRVKCVSMLSRLMNLLFPSSDKNWTVQASPVPNLSEADLATVLGQVQQQAQGALTEDLIEAAVCEFARARAKNLETEIEDQLTELGGDRMVDYVALCRKVLMSGIMYGMGVVKGPFARQRMQRRWQQGATGQYQPVNEEILVPQFEFVPIWDYYPDMSARYLHQMDGQFQRIVMSRQQLRSLADNADFFGDAIKDYLKDHRDGNYKQKPFESELRTMGVQINVLANDGRKYEVLVWDGALSGHYLKGCGVAIAEDKLAEMFSAVVWQIDSVVVRASLSPWTILGEEQRINTYHHFVFEDDEASLTGNGLPSIMRDSQLGVCASTRMILDNAGVVCGPNLEINSNLLRPDQDLTTIHAYKMWYRDDDSPSTWQIPAVKAIALDSHIEDLLKIGELFRQFADTETFVNAATGGDMQKGPSEPFRTAAGASMLRGDAALPFKDVVRNFDLFTESVITAIVAFNRHFNTKTSIQGDFQAVARGSTSLIAKEVLGMGYDELARSLTQQEMLYVDWRKLLRERLSVRDMDVSVMVDDAEAARREQAQSQRQSQQDAQMAELMKAEVRKLLADAVKSLTQSDKNSAAAQVANYNAILTGLEKNVTPSEVAAARSGGGVPEGIVQPQPGANGSGAGGAPKSRAGARQKQPA